MDREENRAPGGPSIDLTYRYRPARPKPLFVPRDGGEAEAYLRAGNRKVARFYDACRRHGYKDGTGPSIVELSAPEAEGYPRGADGLPLQMPFAVMLGCSDARVPTELLFGQEFNDIFNIRVAGNVLAEEGIGSLQFALRSFAAAGDGPDRRRLTLAGVLGHRGCGAVRGTVRAFVDPLRDASAFGEPIGAILRRIASPPLTVAAEALDAALGPGATVDPARVEALVELTVYLNAAWVAREVHGWVLRAGPEVAGRVEVVYGVFDPNDWHVRALPPAPGEPEPPTFGRPPRDLDALRSLAADLAGRLLAVAAAPMDGAVRG